MSGNHNFEFNIADVATLLPLTVRHTGHRSIDVDCFFEGCNHNRRGKLNINFEKDCFKCNYCGAHGGILDLYAGYCNLTRQEAYREICDALHCGRIAEARKLHPRKVAPPSAETIDFSARHPAYAKMMELLTLSDKNRSDLKTRGLTEEQIQQHGYRSTPAFGNVNLANRLIASGI